MEGRGSAYGEWVCLQGVCIQEGVCLGASASPELGKRAVRILLKCFLVSKTNFEDNVRRVFELSNCRNTG